MATNRIITRGLGASRGLPGRAGLITQGYGGIPVVVVQALARRRAAAAGTAEIVKEIQLITIWAKLIEVNNQQPVRKVEGSITVEANDLNVKVMLERVKTAVNKAYNAIKVSVQRIR